MSLDGELDQMHADGARVCAPDPDDVWGVTLAGVVVCPTCRAGLTRDRVIRPAVDGDPKRGHYPHILNACCLCAAPRPAGVDLITVMLTAEDRT